MANVTAYVVQRATCLGVLWLSLNSLGCGSSEPAVGAADYKITRAMSDLYSSFMTSHGGQPPKSEQEFRQYLADKQSFLERNQLSVDKMFTSPRNGQPLDWVYGAKAPRVTPDIQAVGYERASVDGKRLAIGLGGRYAEVDDAAFKAAFPNVK